MADVIENKSSTGDTVDTVGNYFVSNYPPYSFWKSENVADAIRALQSPAMPDTPLGLYLHIPFCRKRCHFCYFRVYTGKKSNEIQDYLDAIVVEMHLYATSASITGRRPSFVYFGGGTPSFLSTSQLTQLTNRLRHLLSWNDAEEITFECEPGTLTAKKLEVIREIGVTRLSLGVENFDDYILELNGRAHRSKEIFRSYDIARELAFPQINIDLIAGMLGETADNWRDSVRKAIDLEPDSVTIYQLEIPYNTTIYKNISETGHTPASLATWDDKRRWVDYAFSEFEKHGYTVTSGYTVVKDPGRCRFIYRDSLWTGADLVGLGVASFSHMSGTHYQNQHHIGPFIASLGSGEFPIHRALTMTGQEKMIRELILQFKLGRVKTAYFRDKFGFDIATTFEQPLKKLVTAGFIRVVNGEIQCTRAGLLRVDSLIREFFLPQHRHARYT